MKHTVNGLLLSNKSIDAAFAAQRKFLRVYVTGAEKVSDLSEMQVARIVIALQETVNVLQDLLRGRR